METALKLLRDGRTEQALEHLKILLPTVDPSDRWRVCELIGAVAHDLADPDLASQAYLNAAMSDRYLRPQRQHFSNYLFALHYLPDLDARTLADEHFLYDVLFRDVEPINPIVSRRRKIHVGYIAYDFLDGAPARFYEPLLTDFDRDEFNVTCISLSTVADRFTESIKRSVDRYITLDVRSLEDSARSIADLELDILFDLGGHSDGGSTLQLMAYRPAPVQIVGIGWLDTTGLNAIDYILADDFLTPRGAENFFVEKFMRVPHALTFTPKRLARDRIKHSTPTFGAFNNFMKITDEYLECVATILSRVPNARMIFQDTIRIPARRRRLIERIKKILPTDRIEVRLGRDDWLDDYAAVDVMLDTFPYNGGAMTATALCMGVPVVSIAGDRYSSRFGADILRAAGLEELIVEDREAWIERAIEIVEAPIDVLERVRGSALLDGKNFVRALEDIYKKIIDDNDSL